MLTVGRGEWGEWWGMFLFISHRAKQAERANAMATHAGFLSQVGSWEIWGRKGAMTRDNLVMRIPPKNKKPPHVENEGQF